jgi:hypothetical protein
VASKTAPAEKNQGGARTAFTDEQIAHFKAILPELIPQGKTLRQILAVKGMCSMTYLSRELLPNDKDFSNQYARALELRNDYWADELVEIADDGRNDWMETKYDYKVDREAVDRSKLRVEARKWLMGKSQLRKNGEKIDVKLSRLASILGPT